MTKKTRRVVFWLAFFIFVVVTPVIIGYARGYRFDFQRMAVTRVGAILLESRPKGAAIWVNDNDTGKKTSAVIRNLLPFRSYVIEVKKEGYWPWVKELEVQPEKITTAENIILFPKDFSLEEELEEKIVSFALAPSGAQALLVLDDLTIHLFNEADKSLKPLLFPDRLKTIAITDVRWSPDSRRVILARQTQTQTTWYLFITATGLLTNINEAYQNSLVPKSNLTKPPTELLAAAVDFLDGGGTQLVALTKEGVMLIDLGAKTIEIIETSGVQGVAANAGRLFVLAGPDMLMINDDPAKVALRAEARLRFAPDYISISPDGEKLAYFHKYTVGVIWLKDATKKPLKKRGDQEIVLQPIQPIKKFFWHGSSEYTMALLANGEFMVGELDTRGDQNLWSWSLENILMLDYSPKEKSLWHLTRNGELLRHSGEF